MKWLERERERGKGLKNDRSIVIITSQPLLIGCLRKKVKNEVRSVWRRGHRRLLSYVCTYIRYRVIVELLDEHNVHNVQCENNKKCDSGILYKMQNVMTSRFALCRLLAIRSSNQTKITMLTFHIADWDDGVW